MISNFFRKAAIATVSALYQGVQAVTTNDISGSTGVASEETSTVAAPWYLSPAVPAIMVGLMGVGILIATGCRNDLQYQAFLEGREENYGDEENANHQLLAAPH